MLLHGQAIVVQAEHWFKAESATGRPKQVALEIIIFLDRNRDTGQQIDQEEDGIIFIGHIQAATAAPRLAGAGCAEWRNIQGRHFLLELQGQPVQKCDGVVNRGNGQEDLPVL